MDVLPCDCCSAEIKALFQEWIECYGCEHRLNQSNEMSNRESRRPRTPLNKSNAVSNTLKTKEIADKLIPLMEKCGSLFSASAIEVQAPLELRSYRLFFTSASSSSNSVTASSRRASGSSAATVGAMISDSAASTTSWPAARMSAEWHKSRWLAWRSLVQWQHR